MKRKQWIAAMAAVVLLCGMTACGNHPDSASSDEGAASGTATQGGASTDEGEVLISGTTTSTAPTETTVSTKATASKKTTTTKSTKSTSKIATVTTTVPAGAPTIKQDPNDANAVLPTIDLSGLKKELSVCVDWDPSNKWVKGWEEAFRACYDPKKEVTITYKLASPSMKASKLGVWKSSGKAPDVVYIKPEESWPTLVNKGLTQAVDGYVDLSTAFWGSVKEIRDGLKIGGKTHALVTSSYPTGMVIYSPRVMANAGLTDPAKLFYSNQWTWDVFEQYCKKLTKLNTTDATKSKYGVFLHYAEPFLPAGGKDLIEYTNGKWKSNLSDPTITAEMEWLRKLGNTGNKYALTSEQDMVTVRKMTVNEQVGMYVTAEAPSFEFPEQIKSGALRFVPIPRYTSSKVYYTAATVDAFYVCAGANNPKMGVAFATAVRAIDVLNLKLSTTGDKEAPDDQLYLSQYASKTLVGVPMQFRRLAGTVEYWDIYGPVFNEGKSYSALVKEKEPVIMEALNKE